MARSVTIFPCLPVCGKSCHCNQIRKPPDPRAGVSPKPRPTDDCPAVGAAFAGFMSREGPRPNHQVRFARTHSKAFSA
jgi:hypothetical protein